MRDQGLHRRIEAVALFELERQAFGQIARAYSGRIKALQDDEHGLDLLHAGAEPFRNAIQIAAEISGLVDEIDEILPDHAPRGIGDGERELLAQPVGERGFRRNECFEIVVAVVAATRADTRPFRISRRAFGGARAAYFGVIGKNILGAGVEWLFDRVRTRLGFADVPAIAVHGELIRRLRGVGLVRTPFLFRARFKERIALEFRVDIRHQIQI